MNKKLLWMLFIMLMSVSVFAQDITVNGVVTDKETGQTIPAVNINVKGTNLRLATNTNGAYSINDLKSTSVLVFSYMGYKQQEITVGTRTKINVPMASDYANLDEIVVVGFGTKKKINIAGAIDQISGKQLESRPLTSAAAGLQGISPGLNITYTGGAPGSVPNINIRGYTSINGGSPLIVIDGIPSASNDDMLRLTPSDITSFTVLRDAASAAIYGARAAFGVVLITTRQGVAGHNVVSYNTFTSWGKPTLLPKPVTDPYIFSRVLETSTDNTPWDYVNYSDEYYRWAKERSDNPSVADTRINPTDPTEWEYMGSNDWNSYFLNNSSLSTSHTLTFSGGATVNEKPLTYYLSADYSKDNGLNKLTDDYFNRYGLRSRVGFSPVSWLKIDNNTNVYETKRALPNSNLTDLYYLMPTDVVKNPDGTWANTNAGNLAAKLVDGGNNLQTMVGFQNITSATALFLKGDLQVNADASFKRELWKRDLVAKNYKIGYGPNDVRQEGGLDSVSNSNSYLYNNAFNVYTTYRKTLGDHAMSAMVGFNSENYNYSTTNAARTGLISSTVPYLSLTNGIATASGGYAAYATNSAFSRLNYTYKDRYILEATGRYDGSSRFPVQRRWGFFPSGSVAWIASQEEFFKPLAPTLSTFKLRSSYGELGNQNVGDFAYIQSLATRPSDYLIGGAGQNQIITGAPGLNVNPQNYTWERVSTLNLGTDIGVLNDKLSFTFDYFIRDTKGMLTGGEELPGVLGTRVPSQNAADLRTKGWELSVTYRDRFTLGEKPFSFDAKFFVSDSKSKITRFKNDQQLFSPANATGKDVIYREGQTIGEIWGLENDGMFRNAAEIAALDQSSLIPWGALSIVEGWPKYKDLNGDGKIERGLSANDPKDMKVIGNSTDRYSVGANLNMDWRGFDLSVFVQGVLKRDFYPHNYLFWGPFQQPYANVYPWNLDYYRGAADSPEQRAGHSASYIAAGLADANPNSYYPVLQSWLADSNYGSGLDIPQTKYLLNGAYLRIKNVSLGYTFPVNWTKKFSVTRLRIFATGENLFEFSAIKKYVDPEAINQGANAAAYPFQRRYAFGLNLDF